MWVFIPFAAIQVNTVGPFLALKHAAPIMAEAGGGAIIITTSVAAVRADVTPLGVKREENKSETWTHADTLKIYSFRPSILLPRLRSSPPPSISLSCVLH